VETGDMVKVNRLGWERDGEIGRLVRLVTVPPDEGEWVVAFSDGKEYSIHPTDLEVCV